MAKNMTSFERFRNRLEGKHVDRPPNFNIYMTFAAHFIKQPLSRYYLDHRVLVDANMAMIEHFHVDIAQAISDPYREAYDFGAQIDFPADDLPVSKIPLLNDPKKLKAIKIPDPYSGRRMSDRLDAIRLMREKVGEDVPVMGWVEGALAEAADLRGVANIMTDMYERPEWLSELLEIIVEVQIKFALAQLEAGADIVGLGDAVCSQISPDLYETFALPYEKRLFETVKKKGGYTRLHICGDTSKILSQMSKTGADIIDLDWMVDMNKAAKIIGQNAALCGNFDPVKVMLNGSEDEVAHSTKQCVMDGGSRSISAAGCEIPDGTPHRNLLAQFKALSEIV